MLLGAYYTISPHNTPFLMLERIRLVIETIRFKIISVPVYTYNDITCNNSLKRKLFYRVEVIILYRLSIITIGTCYIYSDLICVITNVGGRVL